MDNIELTYLNNGDVEESAADTHGNGSRSHDRRTSEESDSH